MEQANNTVDGFILQPPPLQENGAFFVDEANIDGSEDLATLQKNFYEKQLEGKAQQLKENKELHELRKDYAGKLFRLIKAWIAGVVILLILLGFTNGTSATFVAIGLTLGVIANCLHDLKTTVATYEKSFRAVRLVLGIGALFLTVWGLLLNIECRFGLCLSMSKSFFHLSDTIIISIITSTTATVIGLFGIAAYWLFGNGETKARKQSDQKNKSE